MVNFETMCILQGRIQGGHTHHAPPPPPPPKIGENMIFWHEIPQQILRLPPLGAIFLSAPSLT